MRALSETPEGSALGSTLDNFKFFFFLSVKENLSSNLQKVWSEASVCRPGAVASAQTLSYVCCTSQRWLLTHKSVLSERSSQLNTEPGGQQSGREDGKCPFLPFF